MAALVGGRLRGIKTNTSPKSPQVLAALGRLDPEDPRRFADELAALHRQTGFKVLGGCCGTDQCHIAALADRLTAGG